MSIEAATEMGEEKLKINLQINDPYKRLETESSENIKGKIFDLIIMKEDRLKQLDAMIHEDNKVLFILILKPNHALIYHQLFFHFQQRYYVASSLPSTATSEIFTGGPETSGKRDSMSPPGSLSHSSQLRVAKTPSR
jgi:hypothetical protein